MERETEQIIRYGQALASALRAFVVLEKEAGWFERALIRLLRATYRQRLRYMVGDLPSEISEEFWQKLHHIAESKAE